MAKLEKQDSKEYKAPRILKLANMTLSTSTIILHAALPLLYSKWGLSKRTACTMALFSIATPIMCTGIDKYTSPTNSYEKNFHSSH